MKFFLLTLLLLASVSARAQQLQYEGTAAPGEPLEQYFAAEDQNYNKSIIYVFLRQRRLLRLSADNRYDRTGIQPLLQRPIQLICH